jgi:transcription elongation factor GreA
MIFKKTPMTKAGASMLEKELDHLKRVERRNVSNKIAEARAHGDLKENAEYHAAREQQSFIEGRIQDIESKLSNAEIIDVTNVVHHGRVVFGATVELINVDTEDRVIYHIVGEDEANIKQGKISVNSPIARAIIGKEEGDVVDIRIPTGTVTYEVEQITYV